MNLFIQGIQHLVAVISGLTLLVFPTNHPPANLPNPAPITGQVINSPNPTSLIDMITSSGSYSYLGQGVNYSFSFPKNGGDVTGSFSGLCNGNITGHFGGGDQGSISGKAKGNCSVAFISQPLDITYQGNVWFKQGLIKIENWEGQTGPYGHNKGSFELHFTPNSK